MTYFHLHSSPVPGLLFKDEEDFRTGINLMAFCLVGTDLTLYCYCLMSNHFHMLLSGGEASVTTFFDRYRIRMSTYHARKYGSARHVRQMKMGLVPVLTPGQFRKEASYILRNPYKAGIDAPYSYRWSSCRLYFNPLLEKVKGQKVGNMSSRAMHRELHTRVSLPDHYEILDGMVLPSSFVDYRRVEDLFGTSIDFFNSLKEWKTDQEVESMHDQEEYATYPDELLLQKLQADFRAHHISGFQDMDARTARQFISILHRKYGCSKKQILRISGFDPETVDRFY